MKPISRKKQNKIKKIKKDSRETCSEYGKAGPHQEKKDKFKKTTKDYLSELEEDYQGEMNHE
jgi:hypothetical protein